MAYQTITFAAHREYDNQHFVTLALRNMIKDAINNGTTKFIMGGARGGDQRAAWLVNEQRYALGAHVELVYAKPFASHGAQWQPTLWRSWLDFVAQHVDKTHIVTDTTEQARHAPSFTQMYHARNRWMVDNAQAVVAVLDNRQHGGTFATVRYAKQQGLPVYRINPVAMSAGWEVAQAARQMTLGGM